MQSTWEHPKLNELDGSRAGKANSEGDLVFALQLYADNFKSLVDASTVAGICSGLGLQSRITQMLPSNINRYELWKDYIVPMCMLPFVL